jgi:predicted transcriptional regulator
MVQNLEIRGRIYIPVHEAAREAGLSQTYIARLARTGVNIVS